MKFEDAVGMAGIVGVVLLWLFAALAPTALIITVIVVLIKHFL